MFQQYINKSDLKQYRILNDLVDIIDNRGKTPLLSNKTTPFPIIDVGALKGDGRILNYNNCTKFVSSETYNTFFRNGHPKTFDILLSTVGSLAELKLFLENIGCIAQNVVAIRSKEISALYIYQYLNYIKNDLIAYDIGSVQPSIKITHIVKHKIFIPPNNQLTVFHNIALSYTKKMNVVSKETKNLTNIRDNLLPKLMSGEIDVSKIDI